MTDRLWRPVPMRGLLEKQGFYYRLYTSQYAV